MSKQSAQKLYVVSPAPYPIPADEQERLRELKALKVGKWGASPALDGVCAVVSKQLRTPISLVSLIGETEQFFPAKIGLAIDRNSRDLSFCTYAIMSPAPLIVEDARHDVRFMRNPVVTGAPGVVAYAGIPLASPQGILLGTLCAVDFQPRQFSPEDITLLTDLGHVAGAIIEGYRKRKPFPAEADRRDAIQKRLAESEERYALCVRGSAVGLWDWKIAPQTLTWSEPIRRALGITDQGFAPSFADFVDRLHPDERDHVLAALNGHLHSDEPYEVEYRLRRNDGSYAWIRARGQATWDEEGNPVRMAGSAEDISERKAAELASQRYAAELERSNSDLNRFAYVASHDLKAPLRGISSIASFLEEDLEDKLNEQNREHFERLRNRVARMNQLLNDLLAYAKIGRGKEKNEAVSGATLMTDIIELLSPSKGFVIDVAPEFASIEVERMPLQQVLYNLISNAIKHHDREHGRIEVRVERLPQQYSFTVSDDGPGIPEQFQQEVFEMFRTLQLRRGAEGSGIGLAIVKRAVESFGGEIALISGDGQGAKFTFTWPQNQEGAAIERQSDKQ